MLVEVFIFCFLVFEGEFLKELTFFSLFLDSRALSTSCLSKISILVREKRA